VKIRLASTGYLAMAGLLYAACVQAQYWRERPYSNPFTQGYKAFNPYVGGYGDVSSVVGYNPYTGRQGAARAGSDAGTGPFGRASVVPNAATEAKAATVGKSNPSAGQADRDKLGYNPYTGNEYVAARSYDARTGQRTLYGASYNPVTGNGR